MKVDYFRLLELNREAILGGDNQLSSFWVIQNGVEKYLVGEDLTEQHKNLLIEVGVLVPNQEEIARRNIVGPFKFNTDESTETTDDLYGRL